MTMVAGNKFIAIDVETANYEPTSICAIGAVLVDNGVIADRFYTLVKPEPDYFIRRFSETIHGIFPRDVADAPTFDVAWGSMLRRFGYADAPWRATFVAHNKRFDEKCLRATCAVYSIDWPDNPFYCTLDMSRRAIPRAMIGSHSLPYVCRFLGIPFSNHHNAMADAEGCAKIAMALLNRQK